MAANSEDISPWWRQPWPWFLISLPAAAVVGGIVTIWLATRNPDSLVSDDYYKEGLAIHQILDRDAQAKTLGIGAELAAQGRQIQATLTGRLDALPPALILHLIHPTRAEQDKTLNLQAGPNGSYHAILPALPAGIRQIVLEPSDRSWRLTGQWRSPFTEHLSLRP